MRHARALNNMAARAWALVAMGISAFGMGAIGRALAEEPPGYVVEVKDVTAKVGERATMVATLRIVDGYRIIEPYRNRAFEFSSNDDGVEFERKLVPAQLADGALVFPIDLKATKPGKHAINGLFRVGYIQGTDDMFMVTMRLIANVTGTE